jgi:ubiquinone/menaquinone biosynthesis C-methylase UbiE
MTKPATSAEDTAHRRPLTATENRAASQTWWDRDAANYQRQHRAFLGDVDLIWGPEGLREVNARLLGDVRGKTVLELGCGAASGARWLSGQGADVAALDLSAAMLQHAQQAATMTGLPVPLVQADALALPFRNEAFDTVCTAFGAVPFITDTDALMREVFRVTRPGGRWVYSTHHPFQWVFWDEPDETGLIARTSYFDRTPYVETDENDNVAYVQQHRTIGDHIRSLTQAGFAIENLIEPEWPASNHTTWGGWSPLRGGIFPGTAVFVTRRPSSEWSANLM